MHRLKHNSASSHLSIIHLLNEKRAREHFRKYYIVRDVVHFRQGKDDGNRGLQLIPRD